MPQTYPTRNLSLIVNAEVDDQQRQIATGEEALDGDGHGVVTVVRLPRDPIVDDVRPEGHLWLNTTTRALFWYTAGGWIRFNVPFIGLWYNSATQGLTTTAATVTINTAGFTNDAAKVYSLVANQISILVTGTYEIIYDATASSAGINNRTSFWLERNTASLPGSQGRTAGNSSGFGATTTGRAIISATAGDVIRLRGQVTGGANANTVVQGCRLQIRELR